METSVQSSFRGRGDKSGILLVRHKPVDNKAARDRSHHPDPGEGDRVDREARGFSKAMEKVAKAQANQVRLIPDK